METFGLFPELVVQRKLRDPQVNEFRQEQQKKDQTRMQGRGPRKSSRNECGSSKTNRGIQEQAPCLKAKFIQTFRTFCLEGVECFRHNRIASKARENRFVIGWQGRQSLLQLDVQERFVHVTQTQLDSDPRHRHDNRSQRNSARNGEWGAALSVLDALAPLPQQGDIQLDRDFVFVNSGKDRRWLFFIFRIKQNAGEIFDRLLDWTSFAKEKHPDGHYFEQARLAGGAIHSRRLWRIEGLKFSGYPGVREAFVIDKTNLETQHLETQYFLSSYPSANWNVENIINHVLLHWDTETGTFGTKDPGAKSHVVMLNSVCNCFGPGF